LIKNPQWTDPLHALQLIDNVVAELKQAQDMISGAKEDNSPYVVQNLEMAKSKL